MAMFEDGAEGFVLLRFEERGSDTETLGSTLLDSYGGTVACEPTNGVDPVVFGDLDPANDGLDTDGDGLCDAGDPDDDNDGVPDSGDSDPLTATFTSVGTFQLDEACGCPTEPAQLLPFIEDGVRLVKFDFDTVHSGLTHDYLGLSEVRFKAVRAGTFGDASCVVQKGQAWSDVTATSGGVEQGNLPCVASEHPEEREKRGTEVVEVGARHTAGSTYTVTEESLA